MSSPEKLSLPAKIVADEHIPFRVLQSLRGKGLDVLSIFENHRGISDREIFAICTRQPSVLLTSDKSFAAWIVAARPPRVGVILLRYDRSELQQIIEAVLALLSKPEQMLGIYSVISATKTRQRRID